MFSTKIGEYSLTMQVHQPNHLNTRKNASQEHSFHIGYIPLNIIS